MAIARTDTATAAEDTGPVPHLFTVDEYDKMGEAGIFDEDSRVELIDGVIYDMPPIGPEHAGSVDDLGDGLKDRLGCRVIVRRQNPVRVANRSEPRPDLTVVRYRPDYYRSGHPTPDDILLIVEVSDTSLSHDRNTKGSDYARAGLREYWIVDLAHDVLLVHRNPSKGQYQTVGLLARGESITPVAFPDVTIAVSDVLGPAPERSES
jgi:Uma2 family endonuclease